MQSQKSSRAKNFTKLQGVIYKKQNCRELTYLRWYIFLADVLYIRALNPIYCDIKIIYARALKVIYAHMRNLQ